MTDLVSSIHSTSSSTLFTSVHRTDVSTSPVSSTAVPTALEVPLFASKNNNAACSTSSSSAVNAVKHFMGSSPLPLREEAATRRTSAGSSSDLRAAAAAVPIPGPSPSPVSRSSGVSMTHTGTTSPLRGRSSKSRDHASGRRGSGGSPTIRNGVSSPLQHTTDSGASMLPLIPVALSPKKAHMTGDGSMPIQATNHNNNSSPHPQPSGLSSMSIDGMHHSLVLEGSGQRTRRPSVGASREAIAGLLAPNGSCGSFRLSPRLSTRDISATGLRGPIPENASLAGSSQSPLSRSRVSRPSAVMRGHPHSINAAAAAAAAPLPQAVDVSRRTSEDALSLPHLARSFNTASSNGSQGRRLTGAMWDAMAAAASGMALAHSPRSSCNSSTTSVRREDDDGPQQAATSAVMLERTTAVAQPLAPSSLAGAGAVAQDRVPASKASPTTHSNSPPLESSGRNGATSSRQHTSRFGEEGECESTTEAAANQNASPLCLSDSADASFSPPQQQQQQPNGGGEAALTLAVAAATSLTEYKSSQTSAAGAQLSVATTPGGGSAAGGANGSDAQTPHYGSSSILLDSAPVNAARPLRHGSSLDGDHVAAATAAKGATEARRLSDSVTEAVDPKAAKRRLKKEKRAKKAKAAHDWDDSAEAQSSEEKDAAVAREAGARQPDSELRRKRQRKKQQKQEKLRAMPTEERRQYVLEHQRRRAAKKAQRASNAPPAAAAASPALAAEACVAPVGEAANDAIDVSAGVDSRSGFDAAQPPISQTPNTSTLNHRRSSANTGANAELALTMSTPQLASTVEGGGAAGGQPGGGATLLNAINQVRRCTSASGPSVPAALHKATPPQGTASSPSNFRRRFLSDAAPAPSPQYRASSFLCLSSNTPLDGQEAAAEQDDAQQQQLRSSENAVDNSEDEEHNHYMRQPLYGSGAAQRLARESSGLPSDTTSVNFAPHPPAAAAGSGAAAIMELKQQQQQHLPTQHPETAAQSLASGGTSPRPITSGANGEETPFPDAGSPSKSTHTAGPVSSPASSTAVSPTTATPAPARPPLCPLPRNANESPPPVLEKELAEASHSASRSDSSSAGKQRGAHAATATGKAAATKQPSPPSRSSSSSSDHSRDKNTPGQHHRSSNGGRVSGANEAGAAVAAAIAVVEAKKTGNNERRRGSAASSCSSFRSRSGDSSDDAGGSSSYSYSYSSSSGSGSSSSSSSESGNASGAVVAEVLPLKEGCTTPPPLSAFLDLKFRYTCVPQLQTYAEPAVIHEWNLTEGCWGSVETSVVLSPQPFSKGNMRASYYMIDMRRLNCMLVAKRYLKASVGDDQYFDDVSMHSISGHWARVFNAMNPPKKVRFVPAAVLVLPKRNPPLILAMEPQLTGKFVKYNNNCGYVRRNARWTPQAFSHFTYQASNHELMIVDIQGVDDYYTDPQILSPDGEGYGRGNLGRKGIRRFLESHKCNEVCRAVGLLPLQRNSKGVVVAPLTTSASGNSSLPGTPAALERLASGLKEERLPPKAFSLSSQRASSGDPQSPATRPGSDNSRETSTLLLTPASPPPRHPLRSSSSNNGGSVPPSPNPPLSVQSSSLSRGNGRQRRGSQGNVAAAAVPAAPPSNYGVKYVRHPRHALVRPQSQYFTSTAAGGLMAVPAGGNGANGSASEQQVAPQLSAPSTAGGPSLNTGGGGGKASAGTGNDGNGNGGVMMAVPLLRPPTVGRPGGSGRNNSAAAAAGSPAATPTHGTLRQLTAAGASSQSASLNGSQNASPRLTPANGATGLFLPHPPKASGLAALGTVSLGTPKPPSIASGSSAQGHHRTTSQSNSSMAMVPVVRTSEEVPMPNGPPHRRQSFSRRPLFSAVEEMATSKSRERRRRH